MSALVASGLTGLGAVSCLLTLVWVASLVKRDASLVDAFWGAGFVVLGVVYFVLGDGWRPRSVLALTLVALWGLRLSAHIAWRNHGQGEDYRYREMRERHGAAFWWISLFKVFWLQAVLMALISAPLLQAMSAGAPRNWRWLDVVAVATFTLGLLFETVGDLQLARFKADPASRGKVLDSGLWRYTRHPNYFGDAVVWWSFYLLALATGHGAWTVYGPALMTILLLRVSGVALLERKLTETRPAYRDYVERTSAFIPWPPRPRSGDR